MPTTQAQRQWYASHKEQQIAKAKKYYKDHRDEVLQKQKTNRIKVNAYQRSRYKSKRIEQGFTYIKYLIRRRQDEYEVDYRKVVEEARKLKKEMLDRKEQEKKIQEGFAHEKQVINQRQKILTKSFWQQIYEKMSPEMRKKIDEK